LIDATARVSAKAIRGAKLIEYDGSAHGLLATQKERLIGDLLEFLRGGPSDQPSAIPIREIA
jgi:non-heme chloroperoxidase